MSEFHDKALEAIQNSFGWTDEELRNQQDANRPFENVLIVIKALKAVRMDQRYRKVSEETRSEIEAALTAVE